MNFADPLQIAIDELSKLPTIGKKTAQRLALYLINAEQNYVENLASSIINLKHKLRLCKLCFNISEDEICNICKNEKRDKKSICVVEEPGDIFAIEKTNQFNGLYHVLGGVLSPLSGKGVESLRIKELVNRINETKIDEVILALNPDTEGEATGLYLIKILKPFEINMTKIARGIPIGGDIEFADEITLGKAIVGRIKA